MSNLIKRVTTTNDVTSIELTSCFTGTYRYYEVVFENVIPCQYGSQLRAQYGNAQTWLTGSQYNTETWSNDRGGNGATTESDSSFHIYPSSRQGPTQGGIYGTMTIFNPQNAPNVPFTALLYTPVGYQGLGCQVFSGGSYLQNNGPAHLTSLRFFFNQNDAHGNSIYAGSTVSIYGYE